MQMAALAAHTPPGPVLMQQLRKRRHKTVFRTF